VTGPGRKLEDGDGDPVADVEPSAYPLDHGLGYVPVPRDLANFEPVMHEPSGVCLRVLVVIMARVRHAPGWARGSHGPVWLERGQCILGEHDLADRIGVGRKAARRALLELVRLGLITRAADKRGSVVSVPNFGSYGDLDRAPGTNQEQTGNKPGTVAETSQGTSTGTLTNGETETRENGVIARRPNPGQLVDELFAHHLAVCESSAPAAQLKRPTLLATRHVILEAINHPRIREASPEELKRAIDTLAIQGKAKADAGDDDPWWPLRSAWSPGVLADALAMPDEQTARTRAVKRSQGSKHNGQPRARSVPPRTAAYFQSEDMEEYIP
jgi:hypothetical protein